MSSIYDDMSYDERWVANYLKNVLDLWWEREFPVFIMTRKKRPRVWSPDFFRPSLGIYIEMCGRASQLAFMDEKKLIFGTLSH